MVFNTVDAIGKTTAVGQLLANVLVEKILNCFPNKRLAVFSGENRVNPDLGFGM